MRERRTLVFAGAAGVACVAHGRGRLPAAERGYGAGRITWCLGLSRSPSLAVAFAVYLVAPPGARGVLALVLGVLALEGFALAVVDARNVGARGDDWTGFLLAPAGLALCALGAVSLWRSRKPGRLRYLRRAGLALGALLGAYAVLVPVAVAILATHRPRQPVAPVALGRPYEQVTLRTSDGLRLAAWYVPSRNGAAVISYPTRKGKLPQARTLIRHGYGVLLLDARGYDGSDGAPNMFGWGETKDIDAAVAWLRHRPTSTTAGSAVSASRSAARCCSRPPRRTPSSRPSSRKAPASARSAKSSSTASRSIPAIPAQAVQTAAVAVLSGTAPPPSLEDAVAQISPRAVFFIYAKHGQGGEELNRRVLPRRARAEGDLARRQRRSHRRHAGTAAHVRAPSRRLLRPSPPRNTPTSGKE